MLKKRVGVGNQLFIGFFSIIVAVLVFAILAYIQGVVLHKQTDNLFNHSLKVKAALSDIELGVQKIKYNAYSFQYVEKTTKQNEIQNEIIRIEQKIENAFEELYLTYNGPKKDIDSAQIAYNAWIQSTKRNILLNSLNKNPNYDGFEHEQKLHNELIKSLNIITNFFIENANSFHEKSSDNAMLLTFELIIAAVVFLSLILFVSYYFVRNIRKPLKDLEKVIVAYQSGNLEARCSNFTLNEIGTLAKTFNELLENVRTEKISSQKLSRIADSMLVEDNSHTFFKTLLPVLANETGSQIAAVYLLDESKTKFSLYESVGLTKNSENISFSAEYYQGEFGSSLITKKIQFIRSIDPNTKFVFTAVSSKMLPREIITIPIIRNNTVVAIVSLASIQKYSSEIEHLFFKIYDVLSARINGILAYRNLRKSATQLHFKNIELENQRNALNKQSTELAQQNRELEEQKNELKEASRLKTTFLSTMSHELRTPLNSVIALSGVLNRRLKHLISEEEYSYIDIIERNGRHLLSLINNILDVSRIEAGHEDIEIVHFNLIHVINEVVEMIRPQATDRNISVGFVIIEKKIDISSDLKKIKQILQNLIVNAVKFTEIGSVEIKCECSKSYVRVHVIDTGIGISDENLQHIFNEFKQADSSTSRRFGGSGLGLSIALKYARMLHGDITVTSEIDKGSVFTLSLPYSMKSDETVSTLTKKDVLNLTLGTKN